MSLAQIERLPSDQNSAIIQVLGVDQDSHVRVTYTAAAASLVLPTGFNVIELTLNVTSHVRLSAASEAAATVNDRLLPGPGAYVYKLLPEQTTLYVIRAAGETTNGILSVVGLR